MKNVVRAWMMAVALPIVACAAMLGPKGQSFAMFTLKEAACILERSDEPFAVIVRDCDLANASATEIATLVATQRRVEARHRAAAAAPSDAGCAAGDAR
jgi:hypothetical protein